MWADEKTGFLDPMSLASTALSYFYWIYLFDAIALDMYKVIKYKIKSALSRIKRKFPPATHKKSFTKISM